MRPGGVVACEPSHKKMVPGQAPGTLPPPGVIHYRRTLRRRRPCHPPPIGARGGRPHEEPRLHLAPPPRPCSATTRSSRSTQGRLLLEGRGSPSLGATALTLPLSPRPWRGRGGPSRRAPQLSVRCIPSCRTRRPLPPSPPCCDPGHPRTPCPLSFTPDLPTPAPLLPVCQQFLVDGMLRSASLFRCPSTLPLHQSVTRNTVLPSSSHWSHRSGSFYLFAL